MLSDIATLNRTEMSETQELNKDPIGQMIPSRKKLLVFFCVGALAAILATLAATFLYSPRAVLPVFPSGPTNPNNSSLCIKFPDGTFQPPSSTKLASFWFSYCRGFEFTEPNLSEIANTEMAVTGSVHVIGVDPYGMQVRVTNLKSSHLSNVQINKDKNFDWIIPLPFGEGEYELTFSADICDSGPESCVRRSILSFIVKNASPAISLDNPPPGAGPDFVEAVRAVRAECGDVTQLVQAEFGGLDQTNTYTFSTSNCTSNTSAGFVAATFDTKTNTISKVETLSGGKFGSPELDSWQFSATTARAIGLKNGGQEVLDAWPDSFISSLRLSGDYWVFDVDENDYCGAIWDMFIDPASGVVMHQQMVPKSGRAWSFNYCIRDEAKWKEDGTPFTPNNFNPGFDDSQKRAIISKLATPTPMPAPKPAIGFDPEIIAVGSQPSGRIDSLDQATLDKMRQYKETFLTGSVSIRDGDHALTMNFKWNPPAPPGSTLVTFYSDKCGTNTEGKTLHPVGLSDNQTTYVNNVVGLGYGPDLAFCSQIFSDYGKSVTASEPLIVTFRDKSAVQQKTTTATPQHP